MPIAEISGSKENVIQNISAKISEAESLLSKINDPDIMGQLQVWRDRTTKILSKSFSDDSLATSFAQNSFGLVHTAGFWRERELPKRLKSTIKFLETTRADIEEGLHDKVENTDNKIDYNLAVIIIRRILDNFYKHIEEMYEAKVHGRGAIKKEDLEKIKIGNEYDVQRILYALIKPIFPEARTEPVEDTGHRSVRYDIFLDEYDIVIEVKCTRPSLSERNLTEELASDAFHYKSKHLFFFIYDKEKIIQNVDSFTKTYKRDQKSFDKDIETKVIQPINL